MASLRIAYLLDSSVCIHVLRGKTALMSLPDASESAVSSIVAGELWAGAAKSAEHAERTVRLKAFLEIFLVLDFTHVAARHYGEIRAELERKGQTIGPLDLLIAAHARSLGATVVTGNAREFRRVRDLKVLEWK